MLGNDYWFACSNCASTSIAARDRRVQRGLGRLVAGKSVFQLILDHIADEQKGAEPQAAGIGGRRGAA